MDSLHWKHVFYVLEWIVRVVSEPDDGGREK